MAEETQASQNIQASEDSVAVGSVSVGGSVDGSLIIGSHNVVGFTSDQVSALVTQISTTFQVKPFDGRCPYKGLEVFQEKDAELFFGREKLVEDLISRVKESRAVFITGSSGSGKSSLARAGLLPALKKSGMFGGWLYATMKPGRDPFEALASAFSRLKDPSLGKYFRENAGQAGTLHECAESALTDDEDQRLVLFIDQFEEIFTQLSRDKTEAFINLLDHAATVESGRVIALFSMRSDFIPNCQTYPKLNALLGQKYAFAPIGAMQNDELVSAIAQPALRVGLRIDPDLIAQIINDMEGEPGALPLMQFALKDLFDAQQEKGNIIALTLNDYMARGGIHKALERHADHTFASLSAQEQELARSIFSGLIEVGRGTQDTKRTAIFDELIPANAQRSDVESIIHKLADARLITTDEVGGKTTVTISHEKLISSWTWLKKLVDENRDALAVQIEINNDAKEWNEHQRDDSFLYRGARLANAREKLEAKQLALSGLAKEFIEAGERAYTDALEQEKKRADHLEHINRTSLARLLAAQAQSLIGTQSSKQMIAALLAVQSMKLLPSAEMIGFLLNPDIAVRPLVQIRHDGVLTSPTFSPDGKYVVAGTKVASEGKGDHTARVWKIISGDEFVNINIDSYVTSTMASQDGKFVITGSMDYTVRIWESDTGREIIRMKHDDAVNSVAFSPDRKLIISGSSDKTVRVWESINGKEVARMTHEDGVCSVDFSPNGRYVVSGSLDKTARVLDMATGKEIASVSHNSSVNSIAISPDGEFVISSGMEDKTARVWEITTGREVNLMHYEDYVRSIVFSPNGKFIYSICGNNTAHVWELEASRETLRIILLEPRDGEHDGSISSVAFSPDGRYVVAGGYDYTDNYGDPQAGFASVWNIATGEIVNRKGHNKPVKHVAISPDGNYVFSRSNNETVIWESCTGDEVAHLTNSEAEVQHFVFCPDGRYMAVIQGETTAFWKTLNGREIARMTHDFSVVSVAFSPDGRYVVSGSYDRTARIWEAATGKEIARMTHDSENIVVVVAISPDGKFVVSGSTGNMDKTVRVWESTSGKEVARMSHEYYEVPISLSFDSQYVASGSNKDMVSVWEINTGKEVACVTHDGGVNCIAFSPDNNYLITGSEDNTARIWESKTGKEVARMTHDSVVRCVVFSPDGKFVASGGWDETLRIWETANGKEITRIILEGSVGYIAFSPDGRYLTAGGDFKTAHVWEVATGREVAYIATNDYLSSVSFSPNGKCILVSDYETAKVWVWQPEDIIAAACASLPRNLTRAEWQQYIGDAMPYQAICDNLPIEPEPTEA